MLCIIEKHRKRESLSLHISSSNSSPAAEYLISEKFFKKKGTFSLTLSSALQAQYKKNSYLQRRQHYFMEADHEDSCKSGERVLSSLLPYEEIIIDYYQFCQVLIWHIIARDRLLK
jgi:hypothetical protein